MDKELIKHIDFILDLFREPDEQDEELLERANINLTEIENRIKDLLEKKKVEIKIEKGKKFKEKFTELLKVKDKLLPFIEKENPGLAIQFSKLNGNDEDFTNLFDDKEKILLMEYLYRIENLKET